ncbi:MAG TPA: hypothetical protein PKL31_09550 [Fulvivirga sp.]|nr:hypothetical protein [Fulvivirga sp.]
MKFLIPLILFGFFFGCSKQRPTSLAADTTIISIFSDTEIDDLSRILDFFESQICEIEGVDNVTSIVCYPSFFNRMKASMELGEFKTGISFDEQKELYSRIKPSSFNMIWRFSWKIQSTHNSKDTLKSIIWNYDGKYIDFLKEFSKDNDVVKNYFETYELVGDISPSMIAKLIAYHDIYNINDIRMRLLIAIHYLTLNDDIKRKEKIEISI